jgi:hypothetical protein
MNTTLKSLTAAVFISLASTAAIAAEDGAGDRGANNMNPSANESQSRNTRMSNGSEIRESGRNNEYDASRQAYNNGTREERREYREERREERRNASNLNANPTAGSNGLPASQEQKNSAGEP